MKKYFIMLITMCCLLASCSKERINHQVTESDGITTVNYSELVSDEYKTKLIANYAQLLASSISNNDLKELIKSKAQERFDGDYDILVRTLHRPETMETLNVTSLFAASNVPTRSGVLNVEDLVKEIQGRFPNLQVAVPVHCDEWDTENYTPLVAFLPYDYDEDTYTEIEAYDTNGNIHVLSLEEEPDVPVIVVSRSERVDTEGNLIDVANEVYESNYIATKATPQVPDGFKIFPSKEGTIQIEWNDVETETAYEVYRESGGSGGYTLIATLPKNENCYIDKGLQAGKQYSYRVRSVNSDGRSAYTSMVATSASDRSYNQSLKLTGMYFTEASLKKVEKWASGAPEIRLRVVGAIPSNAVSVFTSGLMEPSRRKDINGKWWSVSDEICKWNPSEHGTIFTFDWREEDWDDNVEFTIQPSIEVTIAEIWKVGLSPFSLKFSGDDGGDVIGSALVHWWDDMSSTFEVTGFKWTLE